MVLLGVMLKFFSLMFEGASISELFGYIHSLQMITIIPMIGAQISDNVTTFIVHLSTSLLSFNYFMPSDRMYINK